MVVETRIPVKAIELVEPGDYVNWRWIDPSGFQEGFLVNSVELCPRMCSCDGVGRQLIVVDPSEGQRLTAFGCSLMKGSIEIVITHTSPVLGDGLW